MPNLNSDCPHTEPSRASASARRTGEYGPLPPAHPFYEIVERVTSEWRHLEHALDIIICELAAVDLRLGFCITGQLHGHWPRVNAITALATAKSLDKTLILEFELLGSRISKLEKKKDRFFSSAWSCADTSNTQLSKTHPYSQSVTAESASAVGGTLSHISLVQAEILVLWRLQSHLRSETTST
jgi:hypothetical protein